MSQSPETIISTFYESCIGLHGKLLESHSALFDGCANAEELLDFAATPLAPDLLAQQFKASADHILALDPAALPEGAEKFPLAYVQEVLRDDVLPTLSVVSEDWRKVFPRSGSDVPHYSSIDERHFDVAQSLVAVNEGMVSVANDISAVIIPNTHFVLSDLKAPALF